MDTVSICVPTRQIRELSTFSVSSALMKDIDLQLHVPVLQVTYADFWTYLPKNIVFFEDTIS
jgi:hypothetical protein